MKLKLLVFSLLFSVVGWGQIISWDFTSGNSPTINLPGGITNLSYNTGGTIATSGCTGNGFAISGWNVGEYLQIEAPVSGYNITTMTFNVRSSGTGPLNFKIQYSSTGPGGIFTDLGTTFASGNGVCVAISADFTAVNSLDNNSNAVIRLVFTGGEADGSPATGDAQGGGTFRIDDLIINGISSSPQPEINIQGNATNIVDGDALPTTADNTDFGSTDVAAGTIDKTFTIQNTGTAALNLTASSPYVVIGGVNASDFSVIAIPTTPIAATTGTTTFQVRFNPSAAGTRVATLSIANDDSNENPYNFSIQGTGIDVPVITSVLTASGTQGVAFNYTITATNTPTSFSATGLPAGLTIDTATGIISGTTTLAGTFNVTIGASNIAGSDSETLVITIAAGACLSESFAVNALPTGWLQSSVTFVSNYAEFAAFTGSLTTLSVSNPTSLTFTLSRSTNTNPKDLIVEISTTSQTTGFATATIFNHSNTTSGGITNCTVDLTSYAANGTVYIRFRKASATVSTWRIDDINVFCGPPVVGPEINVTGSSINIFDEDAAPSLADGTNFGTTTVGGNIVKTFTIQNVGSANLVLSLPITLSDVSAPQEYTITQPSTSTIVPGGSTTFSVTFSTAVSGVFPNTIVITNNDTSEAIYNFDIIASVASAAAGTVFKPGDMIFVGYDSTVGTGGGCGTDGQTDKFYILNLVDITPGTQFMVVNSRYESGAAANVRTDKWYGGGDMPYEDPGYITFTWNGTGNIVAGSIISFRAISTVITDIRLNDVVEPNLSSAASGNQCNISSSDPDQIYLIQGTFTPFGVVGTSRYNILDGRVLFGLTNGTNWVPITASVSIGTTGGTTRESRLPDEIECFNIQSSSLNGVRYYKNSALHTGTKNQILSAIMNGANWSIPSNTNCLDIPGVFNATDTSDSVGRTFTINLGNPDGMWTGNLDTDWFKCNNWEGLAVPQSTDDVIIPNVSNQPVIGASPAKYPNGAFSRNLTVNTSSSLTMNNALSLLNLYGSWTNNSGIANFFEGNGTVNFTGTTPQIINNNSNGNTEEYYNVVLNNNFNTSVSNDLIAKGNLTINNAKTLNVTPNDYVEVGYNVTNNGTFNIESSGSLVQLNDAGINTGNISMKRTASQRLWDYIYWSSPVINFPVTSVSPTTSSSYIYKWETLAANANGGQGTWINTTENMSIGKGYIVRGANTFNNTTATSWTANFVGVPNNGIVPVTLSRGSNLPSVSIFDDNWSLIGNPYPSAIDADSFINRFGNPISPEYKDIEGSVRIWTHNQLPASITSPFYQNFVLNYTPNDYITYNSLGSQTGPASFNGKIAAGQSFLVLRNDGAANATTLNFDNALRSKSHDNSQFFRQSNVSSNPNGADEKHRIWLDLVSPTNVITRTLVGYATGATLEKDNTFDAFTDYKNTTNFYSLIGQQPVIIQGRPAPFDVNDMVPMGIKIPANGTYTIAIAAVDGLFTDRVQKIYLEDKLLNTINDITQAPYQFTATQGIVNNRFVLRYTNRTLSNSEMQLNENAVNVYVSNNSIHIASEIENIKDYIVYNVLGQELASKNKVNSKQSEINSILKTNQALIVKVTLDNGQTVTKKVVF